MSLLLWLRSLVSFQKDARRARRRPPSRWHHALPLRLKKLEDRWLPATHTWTGATDAFWTTGTNWTGGAATVGESSVTLIFPSGAGNTTNTDNIAGVLNVDQIQFTGTGYNIALSTGTGNGTNLTGANTTASFLDSNVTGNNQISSGNLTLTGTNTFLLVTPTTSDTINATISGTGSLTKDGAGNLTLTQANSYQGNTNVLGGTLIDGIDNALPTTTTLTLGNATSNSNGTFDLNGFNQTVSGLGTAGSGTTNTVTDSAAAATFTVDTSFVNSTYGGLLTGSLALMQADYYASHTLTLSGNNSYTGGTTVSELATLSISADNNLGAVPANATPGSLVLDSGTLEATASFTLNSNRGIALGPYTGGFIDVTGCNTLSYGGIIDDTIQGGGDPLFKFDTGTLFLSGNSLYTGATDVEGGTLQIGVDNALPTTTTLSLGAFSYPFNNGSFDLNGFNQTVSGLQDATNSADEEFSLPDDNTVTNSNSSVTSTFTVNGGGGDGGVLTGNLALVMDGVGSSLFLTGANTYTGNTTVNAGTLIAGGNVSNGANGPFGNSTNPILIGDPVGSNDAALLTNGAVTISRDIQTLGNTSNAGSVTLGGASILPGTFSGNLTLTRDLTLTQTDYSGETFNFADSGGITGNFNVTVAGNGQVYLLGNNTYTGNTSILAWATLSISSDTNLGSNTTASTLLISGDATLQATANVTLSANRTIALGSAGYIDVTGGNTLSYGGIIEDDGGGDSLYKTDTGTLFLSGNSVYTGDTLVEAGTLQIGVDNALPTTTLLSLGYGYGTSWGTFDLNGFNQTVSGLDNDFVYDFEYPQGDPNTVTNSNSGLTSTFTVTGGSVAYGGVLTGNLALVMDGGTLYLYSANTYTGNTTVNAGTLIAGADVSSGANGPFGNSTNPILVGDAVGSNDAALLGNNVTISRDIQTLGSTSNAGSVTLGNAGDLAGVNGSFTGNLTLTRDLTLTDPVPPRHRL